jgi:hypothetical protein
MGDLFNLKNKFDKTKGGFKDAKAGDILRGGEKKRNLKA